MSKKKKRECPASRNLGYSFKALKFIKTNSFEVKKKVNLILKVTAMNLHDINKLKFLKNVSIKLAL